MGRSAFEEFFHVAESAGFSVAVEALEAPRRLEPLVLYGAELLILAEGAEGRMNRLQSSWAKAILGARRFQDVRGSLAVAECGWKLRLGTAMLERAILFFNKVLLLPRSHPTRQMLTIALLVPCDSWARRVQLAMSDPRLLYPIPEVTNSGCATSSELAEAASCARVRKKVLRRFQLNVVRPSILAIDQAAFRNDALKCLPGLRTTYAALGWFSHRLLQELISSELPWKWVRVWFLVKLTGMWPVGLYSVESAVSHLGACSWCGEEQILVCHVLGECPLREPRPESAPAVSDLFLCHGESSRHLAHIHYVGSQVDEELRTQLWGSGNNGDEDDRVAVWTRDFTRDLEHAV